MNIILDIKNADDGKCLNVDDCKDDIIYYECVTTGSSCSPGLSNMRFNLTDNMLVAAMDGRCATVHYYTCIAIMNHHYCMKTKKVLAIYDTL